MITLNNYIKTHYVYDITRFRQFIRELFKIKLGQENQVFPEKVLDAARITFLATIEKEIKVQLAKIESDLNLIRSTMDEIK